MLGKFEIPPARAAPSRALRSRPDADSRTGRLCARAVSRAVGRRDLPRDGAPNGPGSPPPMDILRSSRDRSVWRRRSVLRRSSSPPVDPPVTVACSPEGPLPSISLAIADHNTSRASSRTPGSGIRTLPIALSSSPVSNPADSSLMRSPQLRPQHRVRSAPGAMLLVPGAAGSARFPAQLPAPLLPRPG